MTARLEELTAELSDGRTVTSWYSAKGDTWCQVVRNRDGRQLVFTCGHQSRASAIAHGEERSR